MRKKKKTQHNVNSERMCRTKMEKLECKNRSNLFGKNSINRLDLSYVKIPKSVQQNTRTEKKKSDEKYTTISPIKLECIQIMW